VLHYARLPKYQPYVLNVKLASDFT
jgi:hypothetical protein